MEANIVNLSCVPLPTSFGCIVIAALAWPPIPQCCTHLHAIRNGLGLVALVWNSFAKGISPPKTDSPFIGSDNPVALQLLLLDGAEALRVPLADAGLQLPHPSLSNTVTTAAALLSSAPADSTRPRGEGPAPEADLIPPSSDCEHWPTPTNVRSPPPPALLSAVEATFLSNGN